MTATNNVVCWKFQWNISPISGRDRPIDFVFHSRCALEPPAVTGYTD